MGLMAVQSTLHFRDESHAPLLIVRTTALIHMYKLNFLSEGLFLEVEHLPEGRCVQRQATFFCA